MTFKRIPSVILLLVLISSCVTQRELEYLQDKNENIKAFKDADYPDYRIKPNDELYITVKSFDDEATNVFSMGQQSNSYEGNLQPYSASLLSYTVDKEGFLLLPFIGKVQVVGKTTSEIGMLITQSLDKILNQPNVKVKLVNRFVAVLGEVRNPGRFTYTQEKLTIYDALGLAGDIGDYGNRKSVILVRNENNENLRINLNLTGSEILAADYYYVRPNDIIYVKPLKEKFWGLREFPYAVVLSTITTGLLFYSIIIQN